MSNAVYEDFEKRARAWAVFSSLADKYSLGPKELNVILGTSGSKKLLDGKIDFYTEKEIIGYTAAIICHFLNKDR